MRIRLERTCLFLSLSLTYCLTFVKSLSHSGNLLSLSVKKKKKSNNSYIKRDSHQYLEVSVKFQVEVLCIVTQRVSVVLS